VNLNFLWKWWHWRRPSLKYNKIQQLQPLQNGGLLNFWGGRNMWTDWWFSMEYWMEVMTLKITSTPHYLKLVASTTPKWRKFNLLRWEQPLNRLVDLDEIFYGGDGKECDLDSMLLNPVASTIPKWRTFKLLWWWKFVLIGGFGWNFVWRWRHGRLPRQHYFIP
jgi:hypothetical protein